MRKIGMALIAEKKASIKAEEAEGKGRTDARGGARDLLTLLLKSNMATEIPDNQRLSDEDVLARASPSSSKSVACSILTSITMLQRSPRTFAWDAHTCYLPV